MGKLFEVRTYLAAVFFLFASLTFATEPITCQQTLEALAKHHLDTARGAPLAIDPFSSLRQQAGTGDALLVDPNHTQSLTAFEKDFFAFLDTLNQADSNKATTPALKTELLAFAKKWGIDPVTLSKILLPYRSYREPGTFNIRRTKYSTVLEKLIPNEKAQQILTWNRYDQQFLLHPNLLARFEYYNQNRHKSVPEMVEELRTQGDAVITEPLLRKELRAFHFSIEKHFNMQAESTQITALNIALTSAKKQNVPHALKTVWELILHAKKQGLPPQEIANAIGITRQAIDFYSHFKRQENRRVPWEREVEDETGKTLTEKELLEQLFNQKKFSYPQIAEILNEAYERKTKNLITPDHVDFRTVDGVAAKLNTLGLTKEVNTGTADISISGFGQVKKGGKLQVPQALNFFFAETAKKTSLKDISKQLEVSEETLREFVRLWSDDPSTPLPKPLRRFQTGASSTSGSAGTQPPSPPVASLKKPNLILKKYGATPEPGKNQEFESFQEHIKNATEGWAFTSAKGFIREMSKLGNAFGDKQKKEWEAIVEGLSPYTGAQARANSKSKVTGQYHLFGALREAIKFYNESNPTTKIPTDKLTTVEGIREVIETLLGTKLQEVKPNVLLEKIGNTPKTGTNPEFDLFQEHVLNATEGWGIAAPKGFVREMSKLGNAFGDKQKKEWQAMVEGLNPNIGAKARANSKEKVTSQYHLFEALREAIKFYNESNPGKEIQTDKLRTKEGIREIIETLRGTKLEVVKPNILVEKIGNTPKPGTNPEFESFQEHVINATEGWGIATPKGFVREMSKLGTAFGDKQKIEWQAIVEGLSPYTGGQARAGSTSKVTNQYHLFGALKEAIELYNQSNPGKKIQTDKLTTLQGIREVIETLRGEKY